MQQKDSKVKLSNLQDEADIQEIIRLLDGYTAEGVSRLKLKVEEGKGEVLAKEYHHGRCDVGSPWAKGAAFDVLEDKENER